MCASPVLSLHVKTESLDLTEKPLPNNSEEARIKKTTAATYDSPAMNSGPLVCNEAVLLVLPLIWSHLTHSSVFSWQSFNYSSVGQFPSRGHFSWLWECRSKKEDMEKKSNRAAPFFCRASDSSFSSSSPSSSSPNGSVEMKQPRLLDF